MQSLVLKLTITFLVLCLVGLSLADVNGDTKSDIASEPPRPLHGLGLGLLPSPTLTSADCTGSAATIRGVK